MAITPWFFGKPSSGLRGGGWKPLKARAVKAESARGPNSWRRRCRVWIKPFPFWRIRPEAKIRQTSVWGCRRRIPSQRPHPKNNTPTNSEQKQYPKTQNPDYSPEKTLEQQTSVSSWKKMQPHQLLCHQEATSSLLLQNLPFWARKDICLWFWYGFWSIFRFFQSFLGLQAILKGSNAPLSLEAMPDCRHEFVKRGLAASLDWPPPVRRRCLAGAPGWQRLWGDWG